MRYILVLLVFLSCIREEAKLPYCKPNFKMTISDSVPVQFWVNGEETFNQKTIYGLAKQDCFCQPWECDDEITIQFSDDIVTEMLLTIKDSNDNILQELDFLEIADGVWSLSFIPSDYSICDKQIVLQIGGELLLLDENDGWSLYFTTNGSGDDWAYDYYAELYQPTNSKRLRRALSLPQGSIININLNGRTTLGASADEINLYIGGQIINLGSAAVSSNFSFLETITLTEDISYIEFDVQGGNGAGYLFFEYLKINSVLATSDCQEIKTSHLTSILLNYTNSRDFDGITYETGSPVPSFNLRIPAMFHQEDNPQTQEDSELSNGEIVTRRQTIQEKRLLETGYMPNYMHKKLQKVLMHDQITIDETQWKRRDPYNADPIRKYNLKMANVLLTKYNSVNRNTI